MPLSKTSISNMALSHCGISERVLDVDTERSQVAETCRLFFDQARDLILESRGWDFCTRFATLQDIGSPPTGWEYRYMYPNTAKRINRIINPAFRLPATQTAKIPFRVVDLVTGVGKAILCDQQAALAEYNHEVTDVSSFSATFGQAVALCLAAHVAMPLRVNPDITKYVNQQFQLWLAEAATQAESEGQPDVNPESEFMLARS